jgi:hypothetical protein
MISKGYNEMREEFERSFKQELTENEIINKKGGMIGDEALPLGKYVWGDNFEYIEYYVSWLPHYRGDSHGIIYKDGKHEHLDSLTNIFEVTQKELDLDKELKEKGLI